MRSPCLPRESRPSHPLWYLAKTLAQTVVFWGVFFFALPAAVLRLESALGLAGFRFSSFAGHTMGTVGFGAAGMVGLWSCYLLAVEGRGTPVPFDCPSRLVVSGPYRYIRNPMVLSALTQGFAVGVYLGSPLVLGYVVVGLLIAEAWIRPWEEADLERRFGESYRSYRHQVRRWIPRITPYRP
jgi:protein-S-isoprenylcysteine O-methyltransferase Ste14